MQLAPQSNLNITAITVLLSIAVASHALADPADDIVRLGSGSYAVGIPQGAKGPPDEIYRKKLATGPVPTNDWWSSLVWEKYSAPHFGHPLAYQAEAAGLRVYFSGNRITANKDGIFAVMPAGTPDDFVLGHSGEDKFRDVRLDGFSDWFVTARFASDRGLMRVSYGHGSPFVFVEYDKGQPKLTFAKPPKVWSGDASSAILGITVGPTHYGLFAPSGSTWKGLETTTLVSQTGGKAYFSIAVLPDASPETLMLFSRYAYNQVVGTRVDVRYEPARSIVQQTFRVETKALEGRQ